MFLPILIDVKDNCWIALTGLIFFGVIYLLLNRQQLFKPYLIPLTWIDRKIQLIPWAIWVYISVYPVLMLSFISINEIIQVNQTVYAFVFLLLVSGITFFFFPTTIVRSEFESSDLSGKVLALFRKLDKPQNCLPSLHASCTVLFLLATFDVEVFRFYGMLLWSLALLWSTMATKQHYFWDVLAGVLLGGLAYVLFFCWMVYE
ncbi:MAG: phosphatase PAP2 family protein [Microscillaceae bacterium]|nr:phosphatase PAP2 family protein [Microscillaceae bacterium]